MHFSERLLAVIHGADQATQAGKAEALRPFAMTTSQQSALAIAADSPGVTGAEIARRMGVTPQTVNSILGRLERDGLIERRQHPLHRVLVEIHLTAKGADAFAAADAVVASYDARLRSALTKAELVELRRLLELVAARSRPEHE